MVLGSPRPTLGEIQGQNSGYSAEIPVFLGNNNPEGRARHGSRTPQAPWGPWGPTGASHYFRHFVHAFLFTSSLYFFVFLCIPMYSYVFLWGSIGIPGLGEWARNHHLGAGMLFLCIPMYYSYVFFCIPMYSYGIYRNT